MEFLAGFDILGSFNFIFWGFVFMIFVKKFIGAINFVPTKTAYVVERLGKYHRTLEPGLHALIPFIEAVAYKQTEKEESVEVMPQECFTKDNVQVEVDGIMYIRVDSPRKASYGVTDYREAAIQLAQTTIRSVIGTMELDRTFEERDIMSARVVEVLSEAGSAWGIQVHRYEIRSIVPPASVTDSMEKQVSAERKRRAIIAESEGKMISQINRSEGVKAEMINKSEGEKQRRINEAEGKAQAILAIADATAVSIAQVGEAIARENGTESIRLQLAKRYLTQFGLLAKGETRVLLPADLSQLEDLLASAGLETNSKN
ncbi:MAG: paraslipin [SAR324 cluster bacterium]|nr:paraslipin [SAR324 cluster bacterium]